MRAALLALLAAAAGAPVAAQPVEAEAADGRRVLLFDDGGWVRLGDAVEPQREGQRLRSASGLYTVHVPAGWVVSKSKGPAVEGEFTFEHPSTTVGAATFLMAWEDLFGTAAFELSTESALAMFWAGLVLEGGATTTAPHRVIAIGDRRFGVAEGTLRFPGEPRYSVRLTAVATSRGLVAAMTFADPLVPEAAEATIDAFHRSLAVHDAPPAPRIVIEEPVDRP